jgi:hypothetical protein
MAHPLEDHPSRDYFLPLPCGGGWSTTFSPHSHVTGCPPAADGTPQMTVYLRQDNAVFNGDKGKTNTLSKDDMNQCTAACSMSEVGAAVE